MDSSPALPQTKDSNSSSTTSRTINSPNHYLQTLQETILPTITIPYKPSNPPTNFQEPSHQQHQCGICKDRFRSRNDLQEHQNRTSWILGYWCKNCFVECIHSRKIKKVQCEICKISYQKKENNLRDRGLKCSQEGGMVRIFFNRCDFLSHMRLHNITNIQQQNIMLMPFPTVVRQLYHSHVKIIIEALMDYSFINNVHINDWLFQNDLHKMWWCKATQNPLIHKIVKSYDFDKEQMQMLEKRNVERSNILNNIQKPSVQRSMSQSPVSKVDYKAACSVEGNENGTTEQRENYSTVENNDDDDDDVIFLDKVYSPNLEFMNNSENSQSSEVKSNLHLRNKIISPNSNINQSTRQINKAEESHDKKHVVPNEENLKNPIAENTDEARLFSHNAQSSNNAMNLEEKPDPKKYSCNSNLGNVSNSIMNGKSMGIDNNCDIHLLKNVSLNSPIEKQALDTEYNLNDIINETTESNTIDTVVSNGKCIPLSVGDIHHVNGSAYKCVTPTQLVSILKNKNFRIDLNKKNSGPIKYVLRRLEKKNDQTSFQPSDNHNQPPLTNNKSFIKVKEFARELNDSINDTSNHLNTEKCSREISDNRISQHFSLQSKVITKKKSANDYMSQMKPETEDFLSQNFRKEYFDTLIITKGVNDISLLSINQDKFLALRKFRERDNSGTLKNAMVVKLLSMGPAQIYKTITHLKQNCKIYAETDKVTDDLIIVEHSKFISELETLLDENFTFDKTLIDDVGTLKVSHIHKLLRCQKCEKVVKSGDIFENLLGSDNSEESGYCLCLRFICFKCEIFQGNKDRLNAHLLYHEKYPPFVCPECNVIFPNEQVLTVHIWAACLHLLVRRIFFCKICGIGGFKDFKMLIRHFDAVHCRRISICSNCLLVNEDPVKANLHAKKYHQSLDRPFEFIECLVTDRVVPKECYVKYFEQCLELFVKEIISYKCIFCWNNPKLYEDATSIRSHIYKHHRAELIKIVGKSTLDEILKLGVIKNTIQGKIFGRIEQRYPQPPPSPLATQTTDFLSNGPKIVRTFTVMNGNNDNNNTNSPILYRKGNGNVIDAITKDKQKQQFTMNRSFVAAKGLQNSTTDFNSRNIPAIENRQEFIFGRYAHNVQLLKRNITLRDNNKGNNIYRYHVVSMKDSLVSSLKINGLAINHMIYTTIEESVFLRELLNIISIKTTALDILCNMRFQKLSIRFLDILEFKRLSSMINNASLEMIVKNFRVINASVRIDIKEVQNNNYFSNTLSNKNVRGPIDTKQVRANRTRSTESNSILKGTESDASSINNDENITLQLSEEEDDVPFENTRETTTVNSPSLFNLETDNLSSNSGSDSPTSFIGFHSNAIDWSTERLKVVTKVVEIQHLKYPDLQIPTLSSHLKTYTEIASNFKSETPSLDSHKDPKLQNTNNIVQFKIPTSPGSLQRREPSIGLNQINKMQFPNDFCDDICDNEINGMFLDNAIQSKPRTTRSGTSLGIPRSMTSLGHTRSKEANSLFGNQIVTRQRSKSAVGQKVRTRFSVRILENQRKQEQERIKLCQTPNKDNGKNAKEKPLKKSLKQKAVTRRSASSLGARKKSDEKLDRSKITYTGRGRKRKRLSESESSFDTSAAPEIKCSTPASSWKRTRLIGFDNEGDCSNKIYKFRCHLCKNFINTSSDVVKFHYENRHLEECCLSTNSVVLTKIRNPEQYNIIRPCQMVGIISVKCETNDSSEKTDNTLDAGETYVPGIAVQQGVFIDDNNFACKLCNDAFPDSNNLKTHLFNSHCELKGIQLCLECGARLVSVCSLKIHLSCYHNINNVEFYIQDNQQYNIPLPRSSSVIPNHCSVCETSFEEQNELIKHMRVHGVAYLNLLKRD